MKTRLATLPLLLASLTLHPACISGGHSADPDAGATETDGGAGGVEWLAGEAPRTLPWAKAHTAMLGLARGEGFTAENIGDPGMYLSTEATSPSAPEALSSVYYETQGLRDAVEGTRDRRAEFANDTAGEGIAAKIATNLTLGSATETPDGNRGSPRWHGLQVARRLDYFFVLSVYEGLAERSAAGYDRAWGALWSAQNKAHGVGALLASADTACGTTYLSDIRSTLEGVREPFTAALEEFGLPDALDRLTIEAGQLPEYDAAILEVERNLTRGLALALSIQVGGGEIGDQAEAIAAFTALTARVGAISQMAADEIGRQLDAASPAEIDGATVQRLLNETLEVPLCAG